MTENWVRCGRCHEVFDSETGPCVKCGTPYEPPAAAPKPYDGLYADRYAGTAFVPAPDPPPVVPVRARNNAALFIGAGAVLIVSALVIGMLFELGAVGSASPTAAAYVVPAAPTSSTTPTLPPTIAMTLQQLSDLKLSAHITVDSNIQLSSKVLGKSESIVVTFDGEVSGGNQWGDLQAAGVKEEMRLVNGQIYTRILPTGKWSLLAEMPAYLVICTVFGLASTKDLQLVGQEMKNGQVVNHFQSTGWWTPDISRVSMADLSSLPIKPDVSVLDLWATPDGAPVAATFSGTNSATDGTRLLDIEVTYTFSDVGVPQAIDAPGPGWSPSPSIRIGGATPSPSGH